MTGLVQAFGSGAMTNSIEDITEAKAILAIGTNTTEQHPVISLAIKKAVRKHGAQLIVADPRRIGLVDGQERAPLMYETGLGVSTTATYEIRKIDSDYFDSED